MPDGVNAIFAETNDREGNCVDSVDILVWLTGL